MSESTALTHRPTVLPVKQDYSGMMELAAQLVTTGFLPQAIKTPAQCVAIILTGQELGIGPMQSLRCINVIQGKPVVGADLQLALFKRDGGRAEFRKLTEKEAELWLRHANGDEHTEAYTMDDAKAAGLLSKQNWRTYPKAMLRSRCITAGLKSVGYEPTSGVYDPEELGQEVVIEAVEEDGRIVGTLEVARGAGGLPYLANGVSTPPAQASEKEGAAPAPSSGGIDTRKAPLSKKNIQALYSLADGDSDTVNNIATQVLGTEPLADFRWPPMNANQHAEIHRQVELLKLPEAVLLDDACTTLENRLKDQDIPAAVKVAVLAEYQQGKAVENLTVEGVEAWLARLNRKT